MVDTSWSGGRHHLPDPAALTCRTSRYTVLERLGQGVTGPVHRAIEHRADGSQRLVALKRLAPYLGEDTGFVGSYVREVDIASRLRHPNIVRIYRLGRGGTGFFVSRELIRGHSLRTLMMRATRRHERPPIGVILSILWQLADALDYAHRQYDSRGLPMAVIHGDLSPANILIDDGGCVRLTDFGASLAVASDLETQVALMRVRYGYMSPEAVRLGHVDTRADLFALGSVAHELLSGRPLFAGSNHVETLARLFKAPISAPSLDHPDAGPGIDALVFRALDRDPARRWQSAAEMRDRLTRLRLESRGRSGVRAVARWAAALAAS